MSALASRKDFIEYEPLLWRVLSKLVHDGYHIQPHDARDLIHDFFLEWEPLNSRFDAAKGEFAPYLATAFYRFGRRRQLKLHRLRSRAVDIEECLDLAAADPLPLEAAEMKQQTARLKAAIAQLPEAEQALLADFLSDYAPGERELAEKHHLTRYRLRDQLAATVSRVALQLMEAWPESADADIAYRVWVLDQSPRNVATELGLSTETVNQAKARFAQALLNSIRGIEQPVRQGRNIMTELDILKKALIGINDSQALECLRANAPQIRQALDDQDMEFSAAECKALVEHPEWMASVYAALEGNDGAAVEADDLQSDIAAILADEQQVIADAWAALLDKLDDRRPPARLGDWEMALKAAGKPDHELLQHLRTYHPSCRKGDPSAERLLQYGLSPGMVFEALRGIELLFNRSLRRARDEVVSHRTVADGAIVKDGSKCIVVSQKCVEFDVAGTLDLEPNLVGPLARSLFCMLRISPLLVNGYQYISGDGFLKLPESNGQHGFLSREMLIRRWCADPHDLGQTVAL